MSLHLIETFFGSPFTSDSFALVQLNSKLSALPMLPSFALLALIVRFTFLLLTNLEKPSGTVLPISIATLQELSTDSGSITFASTEYIAKLLSFLH